MTDEEIKEAVENAQTVENKLSYKLGNKYIFLCNVGADADANMAHQMITGVSQVIKTTFGIADTEFFVGAVKAYPLGDIREIEFDK